MVCILNFQVCIPILKERLLAKWIHYNYTYIGSNGSSDTILSILYLSELPVEKWYPVGLGLGVKEANLEKISKEFKKEEYAVCMFDDWLRNHAREACYPPMKLVAVLLDGEMVSAKMVCQKYSKFNFFTA